MEDGFLDLGNLQSFLMKTVMIPLERQECMGSWERRKDGMEYCVLEINPQLLVDLARKNNAQEMGLEKGIDVIKEEEENEKKQEQNEEIKEDRSANMN